MHNALAAPARSAALLAAVAAGLSAGPALAQVPMTGAFVAEARCPALRSIRSEANPADVAVEPGESYRLLGRNAEDGSHYLVLVPGADPDRRWVAFGCGRVVEDNQSAGGEAPPPAPGRRTAPAPTLRGGGATAVAALSGDVVLAASWPSAFCETKPRAPECRSGRTPATFTLHGLWPEGDYCGNAENRGQDWADLPEPELAGATRDALERVMPGVASGLHRHEWARHGTCSDLSADSYFAESIRLVDALNASAVGDLFAESVGYALDAAEVRGAFDEAFGAGAGRKVMLDCARDGGRTLIGELRINLAYRPGGGTSLAALIAAAPPAPRGCPGGAVDGPGAQ